jgi:predicted DNA-binding antitoxin AbrB/MazE fold protein
LEWRIEKGARSASPETLRYNEFDVPQVTPPMPDLTVTYESGVLKPATPLAFPEGQTLQIRIVAPEENSQSATNPETELLNKIHHPLPEGLHQRISQLMQQRDADQLTPAEHQELIQLSQQVELLNVDRVTHLIELAKHRQTTLPQLIKDLGLKPIEYA